MALPGWGASVAIHRLLERSAFEPEDVARMTAAYEHALVELGLKDRSDTLTETIARFIVEVAQTGERNPARICALALRRLNDPDALASQAALDR
jgi:hypothetical protein